MTIPMFLRLPLALLAFLTIIALLAGIYLALIRWFIAWKLLVRKFPATDVHRAGRSYSGQNGYYWRRGSSANIKHLFRIDLAQEGLLVTGYFARRSPILIPWGDIQQVDDVDMLGISEVSVTVNYEGERRIVLQVPKEALASIQGNVPAERLHRTESLSQAIKDRLNSRPKT